MISRTQRKFEAISKAVSLAATVLFATLTIYAYFVRQAPVAAMEFGALAVLCGMLRFVFPPRWAGLVFNLFGLF